MVMVYDSMAMPLFLLSIVFGLAEIRKVNNMKAKIKWYFPVVLVAFCLCIMLAASQVVGMSNSGVPVLMYHHIVPDGVYDEMNFRENGSVLKLSDFRKQMEWLAENDYETIFMSRLADMLQNGDKLPDKTVVITFDDGYESNYVYAYPILKEFGQRANLAPVVSASEKAEQNPEQFDDRSLSHLSFEQMREMQASGVFEFGSHSYNGHGEVNVDMEGNTDAFLVNRKVNTKSGHTETREEYLLRVNRDVVTSKIVLDERLGKAERFFAYPFGRYNKDLCRVVAGSGFSCALTTKPGYVNKNSDPYALPRLAVNNQVKTLEDFANLVENRGV